MNLQDFGALAAVAVAAIGIPTTLLVGRWQMRAALRTADETARVGIAQAEANYKAALDAVRAQGLNEHLQWRRGVQRDAYVAFLQSALKYSEEATGILTTGNTDPSELSSSIIAARRLATDLMNKNLVIKLEGPPEVSTAAAAVYEKAEQFMWACQQNARWARAAHALNRRSTTHPDQVRRIRELVPATEGYWRAGEQGSERAMVAVDEIRSILRALDIEVGYIADIIREPSVSEIADSSQEFDGAIGRFLDTARTELHPSSNTADSDAT